MLRALAEFGPHRRGLGGGLRRCLGAAIPTACTIVLLLLGPALAATNTTTVLTSSVNPSVYGQVVTFTATVSAVGGSGTPTGSVSFLVDGSVVGSTTLSNGVTSFSTSVIAAGNHSIMATYAGNGSFNASSSAALTQVVNTSGTTTTLTATPNPSALGQPVTFTATVSANAPGSATPTGSVGFLVDGSPIGAAPLTNGVATFTTLNLAAGSHSVTAELRRQQQLQQQHSVADAGRRPAARRQP